jgi:hypothetical protein
LASPLLHRLSLQVKAQCYHHAHAAEHIYLTQFSVVLLSGSPSTDEFEFDQYRDGPIIIWVDATSMKEGGKTEQSRKSKAVDEGHLWQTYGKRTQGSCGLAREEDNDSDIPRDVV